MMMMIMIKSIKTIMLFLWKKDKTATRIQGNGGE